MHTKDFMDLFPSLLPLPKVNTRCLNQKLEKSIITSVKKIKNIKSKNAFGNHSLAPLLQLLYVLLEITHLTASPELISLLR